MSTVSTQTAMSIPLSSDEGTPSGLPGDIDRGIYSLTTRLAGADCLTMFGLLHPFRRQDEIVSIASEDKVDGSPVYYRVRAGDVLKMILVDSTFSPLVTAVKEGKHRIVEMLLKHFYVDNMTEVEVKRLCMSTKILKIKGITLLWLAIYEKYFGVSTTLIKYNANVHHRVPRTGSCPLRVACYRDDWEIVNLLLDKGADPNSANVYGNTCLMMAAHMNNPNTVSELIRHGANVNARARCGSTALHFAVETPIIEGRVFDSTVVQILIDKGAENTPNHIGLTPIMLAGKTDAISVIEHLFEGGNDFVSASELADAWDIAFAERLRKNGPNEDCLFALQIAFSLRTQSHHQRLPRPPEPAYGNVSEITNWDDFPQILQLPRPQQELQLRVQALLALERILGIYYPDLTPYRMSVSRHFLTTGQNHQAIHVLRHGLKLSVRKGQKSAYDYIKKLAACYRGYNRNRGVCILDNFMDDLCEVIDTSIAFMCTLCSTRPLKYTLYQQETVLDLIKFTLSLLDVGYLTPELNKDDSERLKKLVYNLSLMDMEEDWCENQWTVFMVAKYLLELNGQLQSDELMNDLIDCIIDLDQQSVVGNTALHFCVNSLKCPDTTDNGSRDERNHGHILRLLARGAHPHLRNIRGRTPLDMDPPYAPSKMALQKSSHISLQCMAAIVIQDKNIKYRGIVSEILQEFVGDHGIYRGNPCSTLTENFR